MQCHHWGTHGARDVHRSTVSRDKQIAGVEHRNKLRQARLADKVHDRHIEPVRHSAGQSLFSRSTDENN
jgi:hypothetical protein